MRLLNKQFVKHTDRILTALAAGLIFSAGVAGAQFPVTAEQAAELVQAQVVAGADEDAAGGARRRGRGHGAAAARTAAVAQR